MLIGALRDGLRPVGRLASALAPRRTGALAQKTHSVVSTRGGALRGAIVGGTGYGHLVEAGHRIVTGGRAPRLRGFQSLTARLGARGSVGGFVRPRPFALPAWQAGALGVSRTIEARLAAAIGGP